MKRYLFIISICLISLTAYGQFPSEVWHQGELILISGDTLNGQIKYDLETDLVQFSTDQKVIKTYTARKILHFEISDKISGMRRRFYVLPYNTTGNYEAPIIFELILEGQKLTLLSREAIEHQVSNYPYALSGTYTRLVLVFTHYFLTDEGKIVQFDGRRKSLYRGFMSDKGSEIKRFIKDNRLRPDKRSDLVQIVAYYNSLFED
ncbi:MAG: hypothetical protein R3345_08950 [Fulvivirga sp.]|nr:hypothetical protein [Fulvivirga sp.]